VTITAVIAGYMGDAETVHPTIAVATSGDICRILQGYGTSVSY
jgi:hypothetical protein